MLSGTQGGNSHCLLRTLEASSGTLPCRCVSSSSHGWEDPRPGSTLWLKSFLWACSWVVVIFPWTTSSCVHFCPFASVCSLFLWCLRGIQLWMGRMWMPVLERGDGTALIEKAGEGRDNAVFQCESFGTTDHWLRITEKPWPFKCHLTYLVRVYAKLGGFEERYFCSILVR